MGQAARLAALAGRRVSLGVTTHLVALVVAAVLPALLVAAALVRRPDDAHAELLLGGGALALLIGGIGLAVLLARRIQREILGLARIADAVGRGETPALSPSPILEVESAGRALEAAAALVRQREAERAESERARAGLLASERHARAEAEAANRMKDDFLAVLSHELRTPLTAILGWARLLAAGRLDEAARRRAGDVIDRNTRMQSQLIDDLLDISRIVAGKLRVDLRPTPLDAVIAAAVEAVSGAAEAKGVSVHRELPPTSVVVSGDAHRLQQVIGNLLANGVKFTPTGGRVDVTLATADGEAIVRVADTGEGIAPDDVAHVFDRFRQTSGTQTRRGSGLGLGLTIARHLVALHGGRVTAESAGPGAGSTFTVRLPLCHEAGAHRIEAQNRAGEVPLVGVDVVLVEDDADARELLSVILGQYGAHVIAVESAESGLAALRKTRAHVLVSDIGLPGDSGYDLMRRVRAGEAGDPRIPAVAVTAYARTEDRETALRAGFDAHVAKPVDPAVIVTLVARLGQRAAEGGGASKPRA
jgi:signal transduction histidine kinase/CheY-like chemotaxis protein